MLLYLSLYSSCLLGLDGEYSIEVSDSERVCLGRTGLASGDGAVGIETFSGVMEEEDENAADADAEEGSEFWPKCSEVAAAAAAELWNSVTLRRWLRCEPTGAAKLKSLLMPLPRPLTLPLGLLGDASGLSRAWNCGSIDMRAVSVLTCDFTVRRRSANFKSVNCSRRRPFATASSDPF
jgi:hypothetical protein